VEIDAWLRRAHDIVLEEGSFKARIRDLPKEEGGDQEMLVLLADPSVQEDLTKLLLARDEDLDRSQYSKSRDILLQISCN
jgi:hypothetical protein